MSKWTMGRFKGQIGILNYLELNEEKQNSKHLKRGELRELIVDCLKM